MQPTELYSSLYYDTKVKPAVLQAKGERILSKGDNLSLIKKITQETFANETDEVKAEIAQKHQALKVAREQLSEVEDSDSPPLARRPEEYQQ
jgi:hypothetical protein